MHLDLSRNSLRIYLKLEGSSNPPAMDLGFSDNIMPPTSLIMTPPKIYLLTI